MSHPQLLILKFLMSLVKTNYSRYSRMGGIMRGLRTIPVLLDIAKDIMDICPNATWLQYVNPMCSNMIAINTAFPEIKLWVYVTLFKEPRNVSKRLG